MGVDSKQIVLLLLLVVTVISILIALILSLVTSVDIPLSPGTKYGMVFDAGSSHTALYIYQWPADKENDTGVVSQTHVCEVEGPGISSYADDPPGAGKSLVHCLDEAMSIIPTKNQHATPAYLGATAGMRLLELQDKAIADKVLAEVSKSISRYPIDFRGARIITGQEEGSYGWITINYLLESFMKYSFSGHWVRPISSKIYGALDLGGASTQISFIPKVDFKDAKEKTEFKLYGFPYTIYTHSFLCYGQNQALKQMLVKATQGKDLANPVSIPCYPKGYRENLNLQSLYNSPCTIKSAPSTPLTQTLSVTGTGSATECYEIVKTIYNFSSCSGDPSCSFDGIYQPPVTGNFFAFSAFFYNFDFLNLTSGQSLPTVRSAVETFCARDWTELQSSFPKEKRDRLRDYCANANYILSLLLEAYKFNNESWKSISFMKQAANTDIGWTLGYMLNLTNMIPSEAPSTMRAQNNSVWAAAIFFIAFSLALGLLLLFSRFR
ncbi:ectonucleoside triphosphate diphosphohydrolase 8-like [Bufo gargarizans]|uniref:ectonucleoside triphosphate diphosphohydrolase 8-like n=1 Tax=Bufo gargarizans TaxID=30331 RepID=UPI001CF36A13|nr:ectonucleoside triphosphate diphosphohydrolase 8-like [Bufo gargarizans]XP_044162311.1 ectonucleoside triphosphate diphosphohydrolase 8-like [Bufo gargarizans]